MAVRPRKSFEVPVYRGRVLLLRYGHDSEIAHIAELIGLPLGTVKSRLHRTLAKLQKEFGGTE